MTAARLTPPRQRPDHPQRAERTWRDWAACLRVSPELFFPAAEDGPALRAQVTEAKAVCAGCPVRVECLADALARIPYGVAGGLTEHTRCQLRRTRTSTPPDHHDDAVPDTGSDDASTGVRS